MTQSKPRDQEKPSQQRTMLLAVDLKNSVLAELDAGNTNRVAYSPYGHQSAQFKVMSQLGFNGERRETMPEWYFLGNGYRVYNPRLMRFHSPDSMSPFGKGGLNAYMYCGGEPVMNSDPTGHHFFGWAIVMQKLIGGLRTAMTSTVSVATTTASGAASTIGSGISTVSRVANQAGKALSKFSTNTRMTLKVRLPEPAPEQFAHTATTRASKIPPTRSPIQEHGRTNMTELPSRTPSRGHRTPDLEAAQKRLQEEAELTLAKQVEQLRSDRWRSYKEFSDSE